MLLRISTLILLVSHVLGAPTQEPLLRISINESCPEKCMCTPVQDEPDLQDVICPPENYLNDEQPPEDASVQNLIDFVDTAVVEKNNNDVAPEEILKDANNDVIQDASVESVITNMETKVLDNTTQEEVPIIDNVGEDIVPEVTKNNDVNTKEEGTSDEVDNDYNDEETIKSILVEKKEETQEATQSPADNDFNNDVMLGDQPQEDTEDEGVGEEEDIDEEDKEESDKIDEEKIPSEIITETLPTLGEVPEELTGDVNVAIVAKKGPMPIIDEEQTTDQTMVKQEGDSDEESNESKEENDEENIPVEIVNTEQQSELDTDKENKEEEEVLSTDTPTVVESEDQPEEMEKIPSIIVAANESNNDEVPESNSDDTSEVMPTAAPPVAESEDQPEEMEKIPSIIVAASDSSSDEVPESNSDDNSEVMPTAIPDQQYDNVNTEAPNIVQRIQSFEPEKMINSDIDSILLPDGEILFDPDQMDDAMSGKMISEGGEGSTQPQQSTASWVILGLILATFVGVLGYATVRGKMDKKNEAALARVTPSIPTGNETKMNRKPNIQSNEGTEMKVLSRPLLQPAEEENTKEFKDKVEDEGKTLTQVVIADISDAIPYIDDSDGGQSTKPVNPVVKPARKRAPPPPITVPNSTHAPSDATLFSPTTPTLVRTRIVDNSPQIARVLRNPNNNPFDE